MIATWEDSSFAFSFSSAKQRLNCFPFVQIPGRAEHWASLCGLSCCKWHKDSVCSGEWLGWLLTEPHASDWLSSFPALSAASRSYRNSWHIRLHQIKQGTGLFSKEKVTWIQVLLHAWKKKEDFSPPFLLFFFTKACPMAEFSWNFCSFGQSKPPKCCIAEKLVHF